MGVTVAVGIGLAVNVGVTGNVGVIVGDWGADVQDARIKLVTNKIRFMLLLRLPL